MSPNSPAVRRPVFHPFGTVLLAAVTVGVWYAWPGHDGEYRVDPLTGSSTGPYEAWRVVGCALSPAAVVPPWCWSV